MNRELQPSRVDTIIENASYRWSNARKFWSIFVAIGAITSIAGGAFRGLDGALTPLALTAVFGAAAILSKNPKS
jgi:hypothetical protein